MLFALFQSPCFVFVCCFLFPDSSDSWIFSYSNVMISYWTCMVQNATQLFSTVFSFSAIYMKCEENDDIVRFAAVYQTACKNRIETNYKKMITNIVKWKHLSCVLLVQIFHVHTLKKRHLALWRSNECWVLLPHKMKQKSRKSWFNAPKKIQSTGKGYEWTEQYWKCVQNEFACDVFKKKTSLKHVVCVYEGCIEHILHLWMKPMKQRVTYTTTQ